MTHAHAPAQASHEVVRFCCVFRSHPSKPLHEIGTWWYEHAVGIALYGPEKKLSLVETKPGKAGDGARWIYLYVLDAEYETCWTGPGYVVLLTMRGTFAGWRNLRKHDKTTGGMMAGPRWKLSTYQTRGELCSWRNVWLSVEFSIWRRGPCATQQPTS